MKDSHAEGDSAGSRDISTVNTNRLQQIFDIYPKGPNEKRSLNNIAVRDMERAQTQFPAYMNRVYGRTTPKPYEIPNLSLFPKNKPKKKS